MRYFFLLITTAFMLPAQAEQNLMKLFYTPAERAEIDANRDVAIKGNTKKVAIIPETQNIEMKGYVKRPGQPDVVWVNDKNTLKSNKPMPDIRVVRVQQQGKVKLRLSGQGNIRLKPGEVYNRSKQQANESYEKK